MNTLIVPCAGRSSRFPNVRPKWMLYYPDGSMMVEKALTGLDIDGFDQVVITIVREHADQYEADKILEDIFCFKQSEKFRLCILDSFTSCQAETVYQTIKKCSINGSVAVKDSDNYINVSGSENKDFVVGINMHTFPDEIERLAAKSFLMVNDQGIITDIIEKKIVSEFISIGMYGFRDADLFCEAYEHLSKVPDLKGEIYISHVISYLIGMKKSIYSYVEAAGYEDWGTLQDWYKVLDKKKTYIINAESIVCAKKEKYGSNSWNGQLSVINENIAKIKELSDAGAQLIILSSMDDENMQELIRLLGKKGIVVHAAIPNCYLSHQTVIKEFSPDIPYPACESINVSKGSFLEDFV